MEYHFSIVKGFAIFTGKGILNDYRILWVFGIASIFGMQYGYRVENVFRILIAKKMVNDYG